MAGNNDIENNRKKLLLEKPINWKPPDNWIRVQTIDAHTEGEPLRVIISGYPELPGKSILDKRQLAKENFEEKFSFLPLVLMSLHHPQNYLYNLDNIVLRNRISDLK